MITPWTIYWVMQLDHLVVFVGIVCGVLGMTFGLSLLAIAMFTAEYEKSVQTGAIRLAKRVAFPFLIVGLTSALLPSTKTMCAVLTIPLVVDNEQLQGDATEIYQLGIERLKEVLEVEPEVTDGK